MGLTKLLNPNRVVYDGEKLFRYYCSLGRASSNKKLKEWAKTVGMVNPETGTASHTGPLYSMWRWAIRNPEQAFPVYKEWANAYESELVANGIEVNWNLFLRELANHAENKSIVSEKERKEFCKKYGLENGNHK